MGYRVGFFRTSACFTALLEALVFKGGERSPGEPEPPPQGEAHRVGRAGPVERPGHRGPPVEDDRGAVVVVHVAPSDVEVGAGEVVVCLGELGVVKPAEEQRRVGQVLQRLGPAVKVGLQVLKADPVGGHRVLREREDVLAHEVEELAGAPQMGALASDDAVPGVIDGSAGAAVTVCGGRLRGRWPGVGGHG